MHVGHFIGVMAISACFITAGSIAVKAMPVEHQVYDKVVPNPDSKLIVFREACKGRYPLIVQSVENSYPNSSIKTIYSIVTVKPKGSDVTLTCRVDDWYASIWNEGDQIVILNGTAV